ncbi:MAG: dockerin type I repeat-containing protein [Planctomycetota bacterium]
MFRLLLILTAMGFASAATAQQSFVVEAPNIQLEYAVGSTLAPFTASFGAQQTSGASVGIYGYSLGVQHDPTVVQVDAIDYGQGVLSSTWGAPDFFATQAYPNGWTSGVIIDTHGWHTIFLPQMTELISVTYSAVPTATAGMWAYSSLDWVDTLGMPPVETLIVVDGGGSVVPTKVSGAITFAPATSYQRGDIDSDGGRSLTDVTAGAAYLFLGATPPSCMAALDCNGDMSVNVTDLVFLLSFLFNSGPASPEPFASCGYEPAASDLGCDSSMCP